MSLPYPTKTFAADASMLQIGTSIRLMSVGGWTFEQGRQPRQVERDGGTTPRAGLGRTTGWMARFRGRVKDADLATLMLIEPGMSSDGSSPNNFLRPKDARQLISEGELLQDIRLRYTVIDPSIGGSTWENAIVFGVGEVEPWTQSGEDSNEQTRELSILAHLPQDPSHTSDECPYGEVDHYDDAAFDIADYFTLQ